MINHCANHCRELYYFTEEEHHLVKLLAMYVEVFIKICIDWSRQTLARVLAPDHLSFGSQTRRNVFLHGHSTTVQGILERVFCSQGTQGRASHEGEQTFRALGKGGRKKHALRLRHFLKNHVYALCDNRCFASVHSAAFVGFVEDEQHTMLLAQCHEEVETCHVSFGIFQLGVGNHEIVEGILRQFTFYEDFLKDRFLGSFVHHLILFLVERHALCLILFVIFFVCGRPYLIGRTCRFLLNHMVKVDNRHTSIHHQWSCLLNAKRFTVAVHIAEQGISVGEEYWQITRQQSIANHGSSLSAFAYTRLVAYDYRLSTFLYIVNGQCNAIDLFGGQCLPQFLMAHVQSVCYISADIAPKRFV